jgi:hypothetical protein
MNQRHPHRSTSRVRSRSRDGGTLELALSPLPLLTSERDGRLTDLYGKL